MFPTTARRAIRTPAVFIPLLFLGACGGDAEVTTQPDASRPAAFSQQDQVESVLPAEDHPATAAEESAGAPVLSDAMQVAGMHVEAAKKDEPPVKDPVKLEGKYTPLVQGTRNARPAWPVWWGTGKPVDGVNCLINGNYHRHTLISIYKDGERLGFPDGIGSVHAGCYHAYEMHVHDVTGIIHLETDVPKSFKLGQWFSLWNQPLGRDNVAGLAGPVRFYVIDDEKITRWEGNPYDIEMLPHREVLIVTGKPLKNIPRYKWPNI